MKITGIIAEYNPFHNGHLYHLKKTKEVTAARGVICIMNGNFMQRGTPAMVDKWVRAEMALKCGVDLVLELPLVYGIRSAEYFASGALKLLANTEVADSFVFGSESGKLEPLSRIASILADEPDYFRKRLEHHLKSGQPFPAAREHALIDHLTRENGNPPGKEILQTLKQPNNILGIEYIKNIKKDSLSIKPITIKRKGGDYHDRKTEGRISSATSIRNKFYSSGGNIEEIKKFIPEPSREILTEKVARSYLPLRRKHLGTMILSRLRSMKVEELREYSELKNGLENRLHRLALSCGNLQELLDKTKTRAYTWTRIQRSLLHILFQLKEDDFSRIGANGPRYFRILGFNKTGREILKLIKENASLPLVTRPANFIEKVNPDTTECLLAQLSLDILATDIYTLLYQKSQLREGRQDFYRQVVRI
ncbi:MAG: nucleotidyltransferase [Halanaerobiales bacterium]